MDTYIPQFFEVQYGWSLNCGPTTPGSIVNKHLQGYLLYYVSEGAFEIKVKKHTITVPAGTILCMPPNTLYEMSSPGGGVFLIVSFRILLFGVIDLTDMLGPVSVFRPEADVWSRLGMLFYAIREEADKHENWSELAVEGLLRAVVAYCWKPLSMDEVIEVSQWKIPDWLGSLLQEIRHSPDMTVKRLVKKSGFSRSRFGQLFLQYTGQTPRDYLLLKRFELAQKMLRKTEMPIHRIAEELGFTSSCDFTRFFTRKKGMSPTDFRQSETSDFEEII